MKIAFFDTHSYERQCFSEANKSFNYEISYFESRLSEQTASLAAGYDVVCSFVNDRLNAAVLQKLRAGGTRLVALRSAGFNHVNLMAAEDLGLPVVRVPEYSPHAVAEHALALLLCLDRKIHRAYQRVREMNFSLEGLVGSNLNGKTIGIVGTGNIGAVMCRMMYGLGCRILAFDLSPRRDLCEKFEVKYVDLPTLYAQSDVISLHVPLTPQTRHMIDAEAITQMKKGAIIVNTGRGGLIDTPALVAGLKTHHLGGAALDVYEEEEGVFFQDLSEKGIDDDKLARLLTFPNVLITSHQAFLTTEALRNIADTTLENISSFARGGEIKNQVRLN